MTNSFHTHPRLALSDTATDIFFPLTGTDLRKKFCVDQIDTLSQVVLFLVAVNADSEVLGTYETTFRFIAGAGFTADTTTFKSIIEKFSAKEGYVLTISPASDDTIKSFDIAVSQTAIANAIINIAAEEEEEEQRTETESARATVRRAAASPVATARPSPSPSPSNLPRPAPRGMEDVWNAFVTYRQTIRYMLGNKDDTLRKMEVDMIYQMIECGSVTKEVAVGLIDRITSA